jgi:hypothetical protein
MSPDKTEHVYCSTYAFLSKTKLCTKRIINNFPIILKPFNIKLYLKQLPGGKNGQAGRHANSMTESQPAVGETQRIHLGWKELEFA